MEAPIGATSDTMEATHPTIMELRSQKTAISGEKNIMK